MDTCRLVLSAQVVRYLQPLLQQAPNLGRIEPEAIAELIEQILKQIPLDAEKIIGDSVDGVTDDWEVTLEIDKGVLLRLVGIVANINQENNARSPVGAKLFAQAAKAIREFGKIPTDEELEKMWKNRKKKSKKGGPENAIARKDKASPGADNRSEDRS